MSAFDEDDFLIAIEPLVPEALESRPWAELPDAGERLQALGEMGATLAQAIAMAYPEQRLPAWRAVALATLKLAPREAFNWAQHESMLPELTHSHKIHVGKGFMQNIFAPDEREAVIHALSGCAPHDPDRLDAWEQSVVQAKKSEELALRQNRGQHVAIENAKSLAREAIADFAKMEKNASWTKDQILIERAHKAFCLHGKVDATATECAGAAAKAAARCALRRGSEPKLLFHQALDAIEAGLRGVDPRVSKSIAFTIEPMAKTWIGLMACQAIEPEWGSRFLRLILSPPRANEPWSFVAQHSSTALLRDAWAAAALAGDPSSEARMNFERANGFSLSSHWFPVASELKSPETAMVFVLSKTFDLSQALATEAPEEFIRALRFIQSASNEPEGGLADLKARCREGVERWGGRLVRAGRSQAWERINQALRLGGADDWAVEVSADFESDIHRRAPAQAILEQLASGDCPGSATVITRLKSSIELAQERLKSQWEARQIQAHIASGRALKRSPPRV